MTYVAARYDGERNICATLENDDGSFSEAWFMMCEERTPGEVVALAEIDEANREIASDLQFALRCFGSFGRSTNAANVFERLENAGYRVHMQLDGPPRIYKDGAQVLG